jgi:uncharacterized protein
MKRWLLFSLVGLAGLNFLFAPAPYLPICLLQGEGPSSPFTGRYIRTRGIVFADFDQLGQKGFYIQDSRCDNNPSTSDGLFVYLGERIDLVQPGDKVEVSGWVNEYYSMTELRAGPDSVKVLSHSNPLPVARPLAPPGDPAGAAVYLESLEGMRVGLSAGRVVGPTGADDRSWLVPESSGIERVFYDDPAGLGQVICVDDGGAFEITPEVRSGDRVVGIEAALDFRMEVFCLELTSPAETVVGGSPPGDYPAPQGFRLATWNLDELFDASDDPAVEDPLLSNPEYQRRLQKRALAIHAALGEPALLVVQEAENKDVLQALIARPEIAARYEVLWMEGADRRGLDIGLLYQPDQVQILSYESRQGCTHLNDGLEPDGNGDPQNPQNWFTCDSDGDGVPDGSRLFSRPPLVVQVRMLAPAASGRELWLVINHMKSRVEDTPGIQFTLPRRTEQAQFVANLGRELQAAHPGQDIIICGDLNDFPGSVPLQTLTAAGFANQLVNLPPSTRYTYIYQGVSQPLDYILVSPSPESVWAPPGVAHIGADFPVTLMSQADSLYRSSDHDPLWIDWLPAQAHLYLPLLLK